MHISKDSVLKSISLLRGSNSKCLTQNKFWGLLSILRSISTSRIEPNTDYWIKTSQVGTYLNDLFLFEDSVDAVSGNDWCVRFAFNWDNYVEDNFIIQKPNIQAIAAFAYKFDEFPSNIDEQSLVATFLSDFNISMEIARKWFSFNSFDIKFDNIGIGRKELKRALDLTSYSTFSFENSNGIVSKPSELSRAPFIQTLYAGKDSIKCMLISECDLSALYPYGKPTPRKQEDALQVIYYGAPGTGKSHTVDGIVEGDSDNYQRVTFHPDTDYSSFIGCYKPTKDPDTDKLTYAFVAQPFLTSYIEAWKRYAESFNTHVESDAEPYYLLIEEINRGNCAQIFGDVFQLLDRDDSGFSKYSVTPDTDITNFLAAAFADLNLRGRFAKIVSGEKMRLPNNLYIYATMNTSDQSLFPIDSAFKRRWDWRYTPITDGGKGYVINIDGIGYDWYDFISTINKSIYGATNSEDKQMGYWFVHLPEGDTLISQDTFISKVLFYLWSDIYKDFGKGGNNIFQGEDTEGKKTALPFHAFFEGDVSQKIHDFMRHNKIEGTPLGKELNEDKRIEIEKAEDSSSGYTNETVDKRKNKYTFSVNGKEIKSMVGVVKEALGIYVENNPHLSADEIVDEWKKLNIDNVYHFIETRAEFEERKSASKDVTFDTKAIKVYAKDGGVLYISNQYGTSKVDGSKNVDLVIERINAQDWGIEIKEL